MIRSFSSSKYISKCIALFVYLLAFIAGNLDGATIHVPADFSTIQAAVNAANTGDTIQIAAGTYIEQVQIINKSLTIIGAGESTTTIQSPGPLTPLTEFFTYSGLRWWCVVLIDNQAAPTAQTVDISNLTVDGDTQQDTVILPAPSPGFYGNTDRFFAIGYHNANGTVNDVHTTSTRQTVNFNEVTGGGIVNASDTGTVTFSVTNSLVDFFQRVGIDCRGAALTATISTNTVNRGYVLTPSTTTATPNGIQFSGSCVGTITNNLVESNIGTVAGAGGTGILVIQAGSDITVSGNTVNNNDNGIAGVDNGDNLTFDTNTLNFTTTPSGVNIIEGIIVADTAGLTTITSNIMNNIPDINMDLSSVTNQVFELATNQFNGSQTGLLVTGNTTVGPEVTMNSDSFTDTVGYYIQEVTSPNDIWTSTDTVSFDGLVSGHITLAQFDFILTKIFDKHNDSTLGLVLDYIAPSPPTLISLSQSSGPSTGGNTITITGTNFLSSDTQVFFGTIPGIDVVVVSDTEITVTVPAGSSTVDVTVTTLFGTTPIVPADQYTYVSVAPLPPSHFVGKLKKCHCSHNRYLKARWDHSPSEDVAYYLILKDELVVQVVNAESPLVFKTCVLSRREAEEFQVVAVNTSNIRSTPVSIRIID